MRAPYRRFTNASHQTCHAHLLRRTGEGRDVNRHYYAAHEIEAEVQRPVVRRLFELIRFRNAHAAFAGEFSLLSGSDHVICIDTWVYGAGWLTCLDVASEVYWQANERGEKRMGSLGFRAR